MTDRDQTEIDLEPAGLHALLEEAIHNLSLHRYRHNERLSSLIR